MQLLLLFLFFIIASATDLKSGKVKNKHILIFLILGILYYAVFLARGLIAEVPTTIPIIKYAGINVLLAFVVSFIIRSFGVWPAGDAKTYVVAVLLLPLSCYKHVYFHYFPGFTLLINIFISGIIYIIYKSAQTLFNETFPSASRGSMKGLIRQTAKKLAANWNVYVKSVSLYLIVYFTMNFISRLIHSKTGFLSAVSPESFNIILFFIMKPVGNFINRYFKGINHFEFYAIFVLASLYINGWSPNKTFTMLVSMSINAVEFLLLYGGIRLAADYYINKVKVVTIDHSALKKDDMPTQEFVESLTAETRAQLRIPPEGLSEENLALIMKELSAKKGGGNASVYEPIPFVPIIFAGVIFTVITGMSTVYYIRLLVFR